MEALDDSLLTRVAAVFSSDVLEAAVNRAMDRLQSAETSPELLRAEAELTVVTAEIERFTMAIAKGGPLDALVAALKGRQARADLLTATIAGLTMPEAHVDRSVCHTRRLARTRGRLADADARARWTGATDPSEDSCGARPLFAR
jgi:hypothetical protein